MNVITLLLSATSQGMLWSLLAIGVYMTFRILDIADLTAEGSFPLGGGIAAIGIWLLYTSDAADEEASVDFGGRPPL